jgi:hypothetical protein
VEITQKHQSQIEEIKIGMKCPRLFECYNSGFENLGRIRGIDKKEFLECLEENAQDCQFSLSFENTFSCLCPLRIYIANEFHK